MSSHTLERTEETSASSDVSSTPSSDLGQTRAFREYTQVFCDSPESPLESDSPLSFGARPSEDKHSSTKVHDAFHEHQGNHSSAHKNQDDISHGQEFTITITIGPRTLPHSVATHKGMISCGERQEQVLNVSSQGKITLAWTISCVGAEADANTTMQGRSGQASRKRRMEAQALGGRSEKRRPQARRVH